LTVSSSPFIFKIKFYTPGSGDKNAAHTRYIGTRPGADRGEPEIGDNDPDLDTAAGHVKYASERPRSHGLFGANNEESVDLKAIQKELKEHQGVVWRVVVSLREDVAQRMGYIDRKSWEKALRASVPDAATKMGISESNLRWIAAYHAEKGHPHCHIVMWEKEPQRTKGMLSKGERSDVRKAYIQHIYREERSRLYLQKNAIRDLLKDSAQGDIERARALVSDIKKAQAELKADRGSAPGVTPHLYDEQLKKLSKRIEDLSKIMPGKGRMALKYMPDNVKAQARETADWILKQPGFANSVNEYTGIAQELAGHYMKNEDKLNQARQNAYNDIRDRVAQSVIKGAGEINRIDRQKNLMVNSVTRGVWRGAWNAIERERTRMEAQAQAYKRAQDFERLRQTEQPREARQR